MAENEQEATVRFNVEIPKSLHHQFKMACLANEATMTDVVNKFASQYVKLTKQKKETE